MLTSRSRIAACASVSDDVSKKSNNCDDVTGLIYRKDSSRLVIQQRSPLKLNNRHWMLWGMALKRKFCDFLRSKPTKKKCHEILWNFFSWEKKHPSNVYEMFMKSFMKYFMKVHEISSTWWSHEISWNSVSTGIWRGLDVKQAILMFIPLPS
jgi:hypothetical protein